MDNDTRLLEEHRSKPGDLNGSFSKIEFRPLNWENRHEVLETAETYWFFAHQVNQEDVSNLLDFLVPDGSMVQVIEAEARLWGYKTAGCQVQVAFVGGRVVGFLIYGQVFGNIITGRCLYCEPWTKGLKLAKGLINSVQPTVTQIIFQTRKAAPPERMLFLTGPHSTVIAEDENFQTKITKWGPCGL